MNLRESYMCTPHEVKGRAASASFLKLIYYSDQFSVCSLFQPYKAPVLSECNLR